MPAPARELVNWDELHAMHEGGFEDRRTEEMFFEYHTERLLRLDFERLISSSGVMIYQEAKEKAVLAIEQAFPQW